MLNAAELTEPDYTADTLLAVMRLRKDVATAAGTMSEMEARYLVDLYYQIQHNRIAAYGQIRSMNEGPHLTLDFIAEQAQTLEKQVARALDLWTRDHPPSIWARSIMGIGPVLAAGLRAHIDINKAKTYGAVYRFAGLDPTVTWEKKQKRPWNARLKTLCWKISQSFVKVSGRDGAFYGKIYQQRKELEQANNEALLYKAQAEAGAARVGKKTEAYKWYSKGMLPPGHIHARACRYAVKLFLAHYHQVCYELTLGQPAPMPYPIAHLQHADYIPPPNYKALPRAIGC